jgi:hypothetical protein
MKGLLNIFSKKDVCLPLNNLQGAEKALKGLVGLWTKAASGTS